MIQITNHFRVRITDDPDMAQAFNAWLRDMGLHGDATTTWALYRVDLGVEYRHAVDRWFVDYERANGSRPVNTDHPAARSPNDVHRLR